MIDFLKYLRGYLRIKVWGFSPERFMNLCSNKEILLWNIVREEGVYYMCISLKSFYKLRPIARKTGTRVAVIQRYGLPFFTPVLWKRKIFLLGLVLALFFWMGSSLFIWNIEIHGNYEITTDVFETFLEENNVSIGMRREALDIEALEKEIRKAFPQITWTSAKLNGTKLSIEVKENDAPIISQVASKEEGMDLIAEYGGTIVSMIVRSGVPMVGIGDVVEKDAVLVDGKIPVYNEDATVREYQYVHGDADIILEHTRSFRETLPFDYVERQYTGRIKKKYYLRLGDFELKMPESKPFLIYDTVISRYQPLFFEKLSIPIFGGCYEHREYQNVEYEYTLEQAEKLLNEKLISFLTTLEEKGVQIIEKNVKIDTNGGQWVISGDFTVQEPVGKSVPTIIPDTGEDVPDE